MELVKKDLISLNKMKCYFAISNWKGKNKWTREFDSSLPKGEQDILKGNKAVKMNDKTALATKTKILAVTMITVIRSSWQDNCKSGSTLFGVSSVTIYLSFIWILNFLISLILQL